MSKTPAKKVRQPRRMTVMPLKLTVYEKRIVYKLVDMAQVHIKGKVHPGLRILPEAPNVTEVEMPASDIYEDFNDNYAAVKRSLLTLAKKMFPPYEDDEIWQAVHIIMAPQIEKKSGIIKFYVEKKTWEYLLNFGSAYTQYELKVAMSLKSVYSMQMYEYCSEQRKAQKMGGFDVSIDSLRKMFCLEDKYPNTSDFLKRTIGIAKTELDKCSPWSFEWGFPIGAKKGRGNKIEKIWIKPIHQPHFVDPELQRASQVAKLTTRNTLNDINPELYDWLRKVLKWPAKNITANRQNFVRAQNTIPDLYDRFPVWVSRWEKANEKDPLKYPDQIAYVIGAMNDEVRQIKGEKAVTRPPIQKSIFDDDLPY